jgi:hypothetical protein
LLIPLPSLGGGPLATPTQLLQQSANMVLMVLDTRQPSDEGGHAPSRPEQCAKVVGFGTLFEGAFQLAKVLVGQAGLAPGSTGLFERSGAMVPPSFVPAADRLPMDADLAGDLSLAQALVKEFSGLDAPPFQLYKLFRISLYAFRIAHAQRIAWGQKMSLYYAEVNKKAEPIVIE